MIPFIQREEESERIAEMGVGLLACKRCLHVFLLLLLLLLLIWGGWGGRDF